MRRILTILFSVFSVLASAQLNNHWSQNFNDESSLLAGAVVGGGAGASAIFYNPATISEITQSKLSLNASLFSFDFLNAKNAWGNTIDYQDSRSYVTPRFLSYMLKPKKSQSWSFELAFLNVANIQSENLSNVDEQIDILAHTAGTEQFNATAMLKTKYRDDWVGIGGSYTLDKNWSLGGSMFVSFLSQSSYYSVQADAKPDINENLDIDLYRIASYNETELISYYDYRLIWKFGLVYSQPGFKLGLNITTPVISGIYSDGKRLQRRRSQSNISDPETGNPIPDYLIVDYAEKKDVSIQTKTPVSIALGINFWNAAKTRFFYSTMEYFAGNQPYALAGSVKSQNPDASGLLSLTGYNKWLTFTHGARPVFNIAVGYKWYVKENFMVLAGFKTDFNYTKFSDLAPYETDFAIKNLSFNKYHFTGGSTLHLFGQDITAGLQYSLGNLRNQKQLLNLSDPVEFNKEEMKPLQGTRNHTMNTLYNSVSIYLAATFNFNQSEKN